MAYKDLHSFIEILEKEGELIRIKEFFDPELEITEVTDRISKSENNKALLFENTGTEYPVLINAFGSEKRMCLALGVENLDDIGKEIKELFKLVTKPRNSFFDKMRLLPALNQFSSWMPKSISGKGKCQEVINHNPDLSEFPILKCWPYDGGPFITLPMVHTKDPETGIRNVGMYRMQVFDRSSTGMHWHMHKTGARHYKEYKAKGEKMPVAVALGGDPAYTYSATAPLPDNIDEYLLAGFLRKKKVELVKCITQDIEVPADADIIIEGYVDPNEELVIEGPFGDHTGFYSLKDYFPKFHVTCITHRKEAIYPATIVGIPPQEDAWIGKATERIFLTPIQITMLPELKDMALPFAGVAHNLTIVSIDNDFPGQALKVKSSLWGAGQMMFNKNLIIVPQDCNIHNYLEVARVISDNVDIRKDIHFNSGPLDILDHASDEVAYGGKMCIDATNKRPATNTEGIDKDKIMSEFPDIADINSSLLDNGISVLLISVKGDFQQIKDKLAEIIPSGLKFLFVVNDFVNLHDENEFTWIFTGNTDPYRDHLMVENPLNTTLVLDGTIKFHNDNFKRDWPNALVSDQKTITNIDKKWNEETLGEFINSPSNKYQRLIQEGKEKLTN